MNNRQPGDSPAKADQAKTAGTTSAAAATPITPPAPEMPPATPLTPEEQMALYEKELKETDWGHQPC